MAQLEGGTGTRCSQPRAEAQYTLQKWVTMSSKAGPVTVLLCLVANEQARQFLPEAAMFSPGNNIFANNAQGVTAARVQQTFYDGGLPLQPEVAAIDGSMLGPGFAACRGPGRHGVRELDSGVPARCLAPQASDS